MALLPIIYLSVILFAGVAAILLVISYISYRVKKQTPKPWEIYEEERGLETAAAFEPQVITPSAPVHYRKEKTVYVEQNIHSGAHSMEFLPGGERDDSDEPEPKRRVKHEKETYTVYKTQERPEYDYIRETEHNNPRSESRIRAYDGPRVKRVGRSHFVVNSNMVLGDSFTDLLVFYDDGR